ncbi:MAG: type II toxin-antitoxin system PemK/MazF family toxin [Candidatus Paceibacterota bacterium]|jgi:mRNA interferase MazF
MKNDFNKWNEIKKQIETDTCKSEYFPQVGEVWMSTVGRNIGYEQNGSGENFSRPVLVVKKFNNKMFWSVPLSTKQKSLDFYYNFVDPQSNKVSAILAQMRLVSVKRLNRKLYDMSPIGLQKVKAGLRDFLV